MSKSICCMGMQYAHHRIENAFTLSFNFDFRAAHIIYTLSRAISSRALHFSLSECHTLNGNCMPGSTTTTTMQSKPFGMQNSSVLHKSYVRLFAIVFSMRCIPRNNNKNDKNKNDEIQCGFVFN